MRVALVIGFSLMATTAMASNEIAMLGIGRESCKTWTDHRNDPSRQAARHQWVFGFVSGYNRFGPPHRTFLDQDEHNVLDFIDQYCGSNPQDNPGDAFSFLVKELAKPHRR